MPTNASPHQTVKFVPPGGHRACANCSTAKAKCVTPDGETKCDRCRRMNKDCFAKTKPQRKKRQPPDSSSVLQEAAGSKSGSPARTLPASPRASSSQKDQQSSLHLSDGLPTATALPSSCASQVSGSSSTTALESGDEFLTPTFGHQAQDALYSHVDSCFQEDPSLVLEAEVIAVSYKAHQDKYWRLIQADTTASTMARKNPAVFLAVMVAATYNDHERQRRIARHFLGLLTSILRLENRDLNHLQGMLCFLKWYHYHSDNFTRLSKLLPLAMELSVEVGLSQTSVASHISGSVHHEGNLTAGMATAESRSRYLQECKAIIHGYLTTTTLTQTMSSTLAVSWVMQWSPQLEAACRELEQQGLDDDSAGLVAALVRLLCLATEITARRGGSGTDLSGRREINVEHSEVLIASLVSRTDSKYSDSKFFQLMLNTCRIMLYKLSIPDSSDMDRPVLVSQTALRVDLQLRCLHSINNFCKVFFSIPPTYFCNLPMTVWAQLHHVDTTLYSLNLQAQLSQSPELQSAIYASERHRQRLAVVFQQAASILTAQGGTTRGGVNVFSIWAARAQSTSVAPVSWLLGGQPAPFATVPDPEYFDLDLDLDLQRMVTSQAASQLRLEIMQQPQPPTPQQQQQHHHHHHQQQQAEQTFVNISQPNVWNNMPEEWDLWLSEAQTSTYLPVPVVGQGLEGNQQAQAPPPSLSPSAQQQQQQELQEDAAGHSWQNRGY